MRKVYYFDDELNDDVVLTGKEPPKIGDDYVYIRRGRWARFCHFFWYRVIATPIAWCYLKLAFGHRIVGRDKLKQCRNSGYFIYGNHTQPIADAFIPTMLTGHRDAYVVVSPSNLSLPVIGRLNPSLGALPLPDTLKANRNFVDAIGERIAEGSALVIYPEAHVWPYYTKIRDFPDKSFSFPARLGVPVFCFTNVYVKRRLTSRPRMITYVDGPFCAGCDASVPQKRAEIRAQVYDAMRSNAERNEVEYAEYRHVDDKK